MGFFSTKEVQSIARPSGKLLSCAACGLANSPFQQIEPAGEYQKKIMIITDYIEPEDAEEGKPFQGKIGRYLTRELKLVGIDLWNDCLSINLVKCPPTDENGTLRQPTDKESTSCFRKIQKMVHQMSPRLVVLLGNIATTTFLSTRWTKGTGTIDKWRGWTIPDQFYQTYICPTYSPVTILERLERNPEYQTVWRMDLKQIAELARDEAPFPKLAPYSDVVKLLSAEAAVKLLTDVLQRDKLLVAIDYETTGLKPHNRSKHDIICTSLCFSEEETYAFMLDSKKVRSLWKRFLIAPTIQKIAQNMKFEHTWSKNILGVDVVNWVWDTMIATHLLDNRPDITGLKFQTYVQFGEAGYDDEVSQYLQSDDNKDSNSVNHLQDAVKNTVLANKVLTYCALDSWFTFKLAKQQMEVIQ